jgi:carbamoyltransferase
VLILGFNGGPNRAAETVTEVHRGNAHDAAAVLVEDGRVVAGFEQERLDRIKHSNRMPVEAMRACLAAAGAAASDLDRVVYAGDEARMDDILHAAALGTPDLPSDGGYRGFLARALREELGVEVADKIRFVEHHLAHAMSALALSGREQALVVTLDGAGDKASGLVLDADGHELTVLERWPVSRSLGHFYTNGARLLGFDFFDEYKVMGLAPYGDPARFRDRLARAHDLLPGGAFRLHPRALVGVRDSAFVRRAGDPVAQIHMDFAAAMQELLERVVFHVLSHLREKTGRAHLCLAGGVAQNSVLNGKILASGLFDSVFVQPAAHDAGTALGAALSAHYNEADTLWSATTALRHVYWGGDIGEDRAVARALGAWGSPRGDRQPGDPALIAFERCDDVAAEAADRLAAGEVIGWAQGRSEFGPRALGNRSILADPRPRENREIINAMVKKREAFRPFAPAVLEERAAEFFEMPERRLPFMAFVVPVRPDRRQLLGAITHVDGSARVQTVARDDNPRFWALLRAFGERTGVPILLNTSFNNDAEPIVESVDDAVTCFLTTSIQRLFVGDHRVDKPGPGAVHEGPALLQLVARLPEHVRLAWAGGPEDAAPFEIQSHHHPRWRRRISRAAFEVLCRSDARTPLHALIGGAGSDALAAEMFELWQRRLIVLRPPGVTAPERVPRIEILGQS